MQAANKEGAGATVPDTAASLHPRSTSTANPRKTYPCTTGCGQRKEGEQARLCQTPRHHTLNREGLTRAQQRMAVERRGRAGTAVPDTAASHIQPRGPNPRTTVCGGRKGRGSGHGCTRHRGIIQLSIPRISAYSAHQGWLVLWFLPCMTLKGR